MGKFNPNGLETTVTYEYGLTDSYGSSIQPNPATYNGVMILNPNQLKVTGLSPNTTYHFRMKAENSEGIAYSEDQTFTTPAEPEGWVHLDSGIDENNVYFRGV